MDYDVIVIGAGPAGCASAFTLSNFGLKILLIDKSIFPRRKLCGGMVTLRAKKFYREIFTDNFKFLPIIKSYGCEFYYKQEFLNSIQHYRELFFTNREEFDTTLLKMVKERGVTILEGAKVINIDKNRNEITLSNGKNYQAKYIIGADGIHSRVAKILFQRSFNLESSAIGLKVDIPIKKSFSNPKIYFGDFRWSVGWIFPKREYISVGLISRFSKNRNIKENFKTFLKKLNYQIDDKRLKASYTPFGDYKRVPGYKNIILCGDAAGLVDPITGDGISYAFQSGYLGALAIKDIIGTNQTLLYSYKKRYKKMTRNLDYANLLKYLLFSESGEKMLFDNLSENNQLIVKGLDLISDEISYNRFFKYISKKLASNTIARFI